MTCTPKLLACLALAYCAAAVSIRQRIAQRKALLGNVVAESVMETALTGKLHAHIPIINTIESCVFDAEDKSQINENKATLHQYNATKNVIRDAKLPACRAQIEAALEACACDVSKCGAPVKKAMACHPVLVQELQDLKANTTYLRQQNTNLQSDIEGSSCESWILVADAIAKAIGSVISELVSILEFVACKILDFALQFVGGILNVIIEEASGGTLEALQASNPMCLKHDAVFGGSGGIVTKANPLNPTNRFQSARLGWEIFVAICQKSGISALENFANNADTKTIAFVTQEVWAAICGAVGTLLMGFVTQFINCNLGCACALPQLRLLERSASLNQRRIAAAPPPRVTGRWVSGNNGSEDCSTTCGALGARYPMHFSASHKSPCCPAGNAFGKTPTCSLCLCNGTPTPTSAPTQSPTSAPSVSPTASPTSSPTLAGRCVPRAGMDAWVEHCVNNYEQGSCEAHASRTYCEWDAQLHSPPEGTCEVKTGKGAWAANCKGQSYAACLELEDSYCDWVPACACSGATPCDHDNTGDDTCFAYHFNTTCPPGTTDCTVRQVE